MKVKIKDIVVKDRARKDVGNLEKLKESIKRVGLINPICITKEDYRLIAGGRRLQACTELQMEEIEVHFYDELDETDQKIIELSENIHEVLTWQEESDLITQIHDLFQKKHGIAKRHSAIDGWTIEKTADMLGMSVGSVSNSLKLAENVKILPELGNFKTKTQVMKQISKIEELIILNRLNDLTENKTDQSSELYQIVLGNACEYIKTIENNLVSLVIFDPPWGIDAQVVANARVGGDQMNYNDSIETATDLRNQLLPEIYRVMKDGSCLYYFCGAQFFGELLSILEDIGFDYIRSVPLVWVKESGAFTDMEYYFMPATEFILFATKGIRRLNFASSDVLRYNRPLNTERIHTQQKSIELLKFLINISTVPKDVVLDPTAGSFVTCVAATLLNRRSIGIEQNKDSYLKGSNWLKGLDLCKQ